MTTLKKGTGEPSSQGATAREGSSHVPTLPSFKPKRATNKQFHIIADGCHYTNYWTNT